MKKISRLFNVKSGKNASIAYSVLTFVNAGMAILGYWNIDSLTTLGKTMCYMASAISVSAGYDCAKKAIEHYEIAKKDQINPPGM